MNSNEKFLTMVGACAQMEGKKLHQMVLDLYLKSFHELGAEIWVEALEKGLKSARLPLIADVEKAAGISAPTDDEEALEAAEMIWKAIGKFGWPNAGEAMAWLNPLARDIVQCHGTWQSICGAADDHQKSYQITQWKQTGKRLIKEWNNQQFNERKQLSASTQDFVGMIEEARNGLQK